MDTHEEIKSSLIQGKPALILRWIFRIWDGGPWTRLIWLRIGTGGGQL
jgi:hypothetical protein